MRHEEAQQYQFLPIQCPNCGLDGKVKISRLDRTFTCKQCRKVFHVTLDGVVSGDRPPDAPLGEEQFAPEPPPPLLVRWFEKLPRIGKYLAIGVVVIAALYGLSLLMEPAEPLPDELEDRAELAAKALGEGDWRTLKRLAMEGTTRDLGKWYDQVRPEAWKDFDKETNKVNVNLGRFAQELVKYEHNKPVIVKRVDAEIQIAGKGEPVEVTLVWSEDEYKTWWLDGTKLLEKSKQTRPPAKKKAD